MANAGADVTGSGVSTSRAPRLPRWTRQEILVLIEGKRVVESRAGTRTGRGGPGRAVGLEGGPQQLEPKWAAVAAYCKRHGVERGSVQCRKRWSNLAGDYKKIKEWEKAASNGTSDGTATKKESFWAMRNDLRREKRLPGFFDKEVYDILDGQKSSTVTTGVGAIDETGGDGGGGDKEEEEEEAVFDSGRAAGDDGLFSEEEEEDEHGDEETRAAVATGAAVQVLPISEKKYEAAARQEASEPGTSKDKQPDQSTEKDGLSSRAQKRRRTSSSEDISGEYDLQSQLIEVLDRNTRLVAAQLEAQNLNCQLDREQRKDQANSMLGVLNKLADALGRIADKL